MKTDIRLGVFYICYIHFLIKHKFCFDFNHNDATCLICDVNRTSVISCKCRQNLEKLDTQINDFLTRKNSKYAIMKSLINCVYKIRKQ